MTPPPPPPTPYHDTPPAPRQRIGPPRLAADARYRPGRGALLREVDAVHRPHSARGNRRPGEPGGRAGAGPAARGPGRDRAPTEGGAGPDPVGGRPGGG